MAERDTHLILGLMHIGPVALALPVACLREAIARPPSLCRLPTPSPHVLGGVDVRNELITVIDLRAALNLPPSSDETSQRIVILQHDGRVLGLCVDRLGEVVQVQRQDCQQVDVLSLQSPPLMAEMLSLDAGQRVVSVLSLDGLMRLPDVPLTRAADRAAELALRRVHQQWSPYLMFEAGQTRLCIDANLVDTVINLDSLGTTFSPSRGCIGILQHDGRKLAVLDALDLLGLGHTPLASNRQVLVLKVRERLVGLLVREISRIARQDDSTLRPVPAQAFERPELFMGMLPLEGLGDFLKIHGERLCALDELTSMATIHGTAMAAARQQNQLQEVFLTYRVGQELATPLRTIREILPFPERHTPIDRAGDARVGLLQHRDEVIPIVNLAELCGLPRAPRTSETRLLVMPGASGPMALEVEQVVSIEAAQWSHPPLYAQQMRHLSALKQALQRRSLLSVGTADSPRSVQVLDLTQVVAALQPAQGQTEPQPHAAPCEAPATPEADAPAPPPSAAAPLAAPPAGERAAEPATTPAEHLDLAPA